MTDAPILEVRDLRVELPLSRGTVHAVDDASFSVREGEAFGLVGESGCGKSMRTVICAGSAWLWLKSAEPHSGQKSFAHPSGGRNARTTSSPCTKRRLPGSISAWAEAAVPVRRWHRVQWQ